jgi:nucleotide-binding universal stress UspA family protein
MYKKVLVPLDGSKLAEATLPHVKGLAKAGLIEEVTLLYVVEIPSSWVTEHTDLIEMQQQQLLRGNEYIGEIQSQLETEGIKTRSEVLVGRADQTIIQYTNQHMMDLLVISSHGHTGIKQWVFGSVALRMLHDSKSPVLLIRHEAHHA